MFKYLDDKDVYQRVSSETELDDKLASCITSTILGAYAPMPLINKARGVNLGLNLYLHPYFVYKSSNGLSNSVHVRRIKTCVLALFKIF